MTAIPDASANLPSLLRAWAQISGEHVFAAEVAPWWLDPTALMQSIAHAAKNLGWQVQPQHDEEWDMHLVTPETRVVIRCVSAGVNLEQTEGQDVIGDTWRILALTPSPPRGTLGLHLVAVLPYIAHARDEDAIRFAVDQWRAAHPWPKDNPSVWVDSPSSMPQNSAGTAFPGLGLIARLANGS